MEGQQQQKSVTLEGYIHRNPELLDTLLETPFPEVKTLYDNWRRAVSLFPDNPCFGTREFLANGGRGDYKWTTFKQVDQEAEALTSSFLRLGLQPQQTVGTYSINRAEVGVVEVAAHNLCLTTVPLYDTLGEDAAEYVLKHAQVTAVVCSRDKTAKVLAVANNCPDLRYIIQLEDFAKRAQEGEGYKAKEDWGPLVAKTNVKLVEYSQLIKPTGEKTVHRPPSPDDVATILYTSGTTGEPKGVVLLHRNIVGAMAGSMRVVPILSTDVHLSYLPMAHVYERLVLQCGLARGASAGFYQGDVKKLVEDIQVLRPTTFIGVPRVFQRIYDKVMQGVNESSWARKKLFYYAFNTKVEAMKKGEETPRLDALVFSKVAARFGGRVRMVVSGSAPLPPVVHQFLQVCLGCPVLQGYGLSETTATATVGHPADRNTGHVGFPTPCNELKLISVPEMEYTVDDVDAEGRPAPRGEVCIRGPNVFAGYYKNPQATESVFTKDGFFMTGDIGRWNADGTLSIIDRKKNIFKLSQGEYVAAEKLEGVFIRSPYIAQVFVYGDSLKSYLVAIVVPDMETLVPWAKQHLKKFSEKDLNAKTLCASPQVNHLIMSEMQNLAHEAKLRGFEVVKAVYLENEEFSVDNGLITPTFKLKRPALTKKYQQVIHQLYSAHDAEKKAKHQLQQQSGQSQVVAKPTAATLGPARL
jgi:long-chain acyl-CoA synthetase